MPRLLERQLAAPPLGMGLAAGLPAKGDSAFAKAARAPVRLLGGCQPQLPSAGVSAFASYPVRRPLNFENKFVTDIVDKVYLSYSVIPI